MIFVITLDDIPVDKRKQYMYMAIAPDVQTMNFVVPPGCSGGDALDVVVGGWVVTFLMADGLVEGDQFDVDAKWLQAQVIEACRANLWTLAESQLDVHLITRVFLNQSLIIENSRLDQSPTADKPPPLPPRDPARDLESG